MTFYKITFLFLLISTNLFSVTIAEKRASLASEASGQTSDELKNVGLELREKQDKLKKLFAQSREVYEEMVRNKASREQIEEALLPFRDQIRLLKQEISQNYTQWKELTIPVQEEDGLWHQPDTTVGQLVIDYSSGEHVYVMPPEIGSMRIHVSSQLPVPRSSWDEMLKLVLAYYGIGIKEPMPFLRQLYFLRINASGFHAVASKRTDLELMSDGDKVLFFLASQPIDSKRISYFLEKFSPQEQVTVQLVGNTVVLTGYVREVKEALKIYDFISSAPFSQEWKIVSLQKSQGEDVARILYSIFDGSGRGIPDLGEGVERPPMPFQQDMGGFRVIILKHPAQSLFILGQPDQIEKACQIIQEIENRIGEAHDKTIWWYSCKQSEAPELAEVLNAVYQRIVTVPGLGSSKARASSQPAPPPPPVPHISNYDGGMDNLIVEPPKISPPGSGDSAKKKKFQNNDNFIVDMKTNSIVMVVESAVLPKLKELVKKLDVPKKMVQIEVLLFEKRLSDSNSFGLNLLKLGETAFKHHAPRLLWNDVKKKKSENSGILRFTYSREAHDGIPAFAIAYNFMLTQEDIQINACPTITTVNQTAAKMAIVEQMSINTGVVEIDTTKATRLKDAYVREEYGITIAITPTIHAKIDDENDPDAQKFITLATDIIFDTTKPSRDNRPDVTRRNIKNEVRIADGETVILGGLRKKTAEENQETVPFLGEIPGIGKLFGNTSFKDSNTEMFIFITPRIVPDQTEEYRKLRQQELARRPGDIPEFLREVLYAKQAQKRKLFERGMKLILGKPEEIQPTPRQL